MKKCLEKKFKLSGKVDEFLCELIDINDTEALLKYRIEKNIAVAGILLSPGDITAAFYSYDKPFVLYRWLSPDCSFIADYINIADRVKIEPNIIQWRDLELDILFYPDGTYEILDEDELPQDISCQLIKYIQKAKRCVLDNYIKISERAEKAVGKFSVEFREA
ncbi:DUF402 domain-containing protein [candidate division WOR-3 bacterium]|nr:DUF402 domain-containing protein [candidate division WOR-3 bacterium]